MTIEELLEEMRIFLNNLVHKGATYDQIGQLIEVTFLSALDSLNGSPEVKIHACEEIMQRFKENVGK